MKLLRPFGAICALAVVTACGDAQSIDNEARTAENERRDDVRDADAAVLREDRAAEDRAYARDEAAAASAKGDVVEEPPVRME